LQTIDKGMRSQLQSIRDSVEAATETVIELAEETIERIGSNSSNNESSPTEPVRRHDFSTSFREKLEARKDASQSALGRIMDEDDDDDDDKRETSDVLPKHFPLVVLPGLPARALPLFRDPPLRWLAVPGFDLQDVHKRNVASSHPEHVLFVPPPSIDDMATYENCAGEFWQQRCEEDPVLSLVDIRRRDCQRIESDMRDYYRVKDPRRPTGKGLQRTPVHSGWLSYLLPRTAAPGSSIFSVDRIHPTDDGYDFMGRYIANAVIEEWREHPDRQPPLH